MKSNEQKLKFDDVVYFCSNLRQFYDENLLNDSRVREILLDFYFPNMSEDRKSKTVLYGWWDEKTKQYSPAKLYGILKSQAKPYVKGCEKIGLENFILKEHLREFVGEVRSSDVSWDYLLQSILPKFQTSYGLSGEKLGEFEDLFRKELDVYLKGLREANIEF